MAFTGFKLLLDDWRGYVIAWLALVAVANVYMSAYNRLRVEIRKERAVADKERAVADQVETDSNGDDPTATGPPFAVTMSKPR